MTLIERLLRVLPGLCDQVYLPTLAPGDECMENEMTTDPKATSLLIAAIKDRDPGRIHQELLKQQFLLINVDEDESGDDEFIGTLTVPVDDFLALVVFTHEDHAAAFIESEPDLFDSEEEVEGFLVDGQALLDFLPESYGLVLNANSDNAQVLEPDLVKELA